MESWETGIFVFLVLACIGGAVGIYFGLKGTSEAGAIGGAVGLGIAAIIVVYFWIHNSRKSEDTSQRVRNLNAIGRYLTDKERQSLAGASREKADYIHDKELQEIKNQNQYEQAAIEKYVKDRQKEEKDVANGRTKIMNEWRNTGSFDSAALGKQQERERQLAKDHQRYWSGPTTYPQ